MASCSEHFISIKHRILATFNISKKINLSDCMPLKSGPVFLFQIFIIAPPPPPKGYKIVSLLINNKFRFSI